jgi:hypothetical protein
MARDGTKMGWTVLEISVNGRWEFIDIRDHRAAAMVCFVEK